MKPYRVVILDDDYIAAQALANAAKSTNTDSLVYRVASLFYADIIGNKFSSSDLFILDLMLRNEGLPLELLDSDAQTGQVILKVLRESFPNAIIYVVTAWNLRENDPYRTRMYADRIFSKPYKYRTVIKELLIDADEKRGR